MYKKRPAFIGWLMMTVGFNILYFPMLILGYMGMPRRYYHYLPQFETLHRIATVGSWIMVIGISILIINLIVSLKKGKKAPANPWGAATLEWTVSSPPPTENFHEIPVVSAGPYDFTHIVQSVEETR
jgi:cytochrome c oxidase subunit 1